MQAASEAPRAAAEVIAEMRQKLSDSMVHDNAMLEERSRVMGTLGTLLDAVNHASTEQRVAIDGLIQPERPNLALLPPPSEVLGIEVFAGSARLPLEFGGEGEQRFCGLIAIWTK